MMMMKMMDGKDNHGVGPERLDGSSGVVSSFGEPISLRHMEQYIFTHHHQCPAQNCLEMQDTGKK